MHATHQSHYNVENNCTEHAIVFRFRAMAVLIKVLVGGVYQSFNGVVSIKVSKHECKHPFVEAYTVGWYIWQFDEYLVPTLLQLNPNRFQIELLLQFPHDRFQI